MSRRNVFATLTHYPSTRVGEAGLRILKDLAEQRNLTSLSPQLITYSIPTTAIENSRARGGNALGFGDVEGHLVGKSFYLSNSQLLLLLGRRLTTNQVNLFALSWTDRALDRSAYEYADDFIAEFRKTAELNKVFHPYIYLNYANKGQDPFASYGWKNHQKLLKIQKDIDPTGVFTSKGLWNGFFKLR